MLERQVIVHVREGLHARPATQFVKLAQSFSADIEVVRGNRGANAKSSVKLMLLGVQEEDEVTIRANGSDAEAAIEKLVEFVERPDAGLEPPAKNEPAVRLTRPSTQLGRGIPASEGAAIGKAFPYFPDTLASPRRMLLPADIGPEILRFRAAHDNATSSLTIEKQKLHDSGGDTDIIDALIDVARDSELMQAIEARIQSGVDAVSATLEAGQQLAEEFEAMEDPYIRARAEDIRGIARNVALAILGKTGVCLSDVPHGAVVVADEISAWDFAKAVPEKIAGIVCTKGAATSHLAIMARSHGIPAVLGYNAAPGRLHSVTTVALDGGTGEVALDPDDATTAAFSQRISAEREVRDALVAFRDIDPVTRDGRRIEVAANIGSLKEAGPALASGAMGVGLFRTELLFMERKRLPDEDEQTAIYTELARAFAPRPVIIRTLDIGGDKPIAGVDFPQEDNPFLGWRGVRMCLDRPDIFKPQLKALLRAAVAGNVKVMVPMITIVEEVVAVKELLSECRLELAREEKAAGSVELGIMIETPAAAFLAEELAKEVEFFSIGSNDLTQYIMAADRLSPRVANLNRTDHPAVLRAIEMVCRAAKTAGIWVGICGEAAARPDLIPSFVAMGITELSMSPMAIARAKKTIIEI